MKRLFITIFCLFFLNACSMTKLNEKGKNVQLLNTFPATANLSDYEELGTVSSTAGINGRSAADNITQCRNDLRNKAANLGADIIILEHQQLGSQSLPLNSGGCGNCITLVGAAYKLTNKKDKK